MKLVELLPGIGKLFSVFRLESIGLSAPQCRLTRPNAHAPGSIGLRKVEFPVVDDICESHDWYSEGPSGVKSGDFQPKKWTLTK